MHLILMLLYYAVNSRHEGRLPNFRDRTGEIVKANKVHYITNQHNIKIYVD